MAKRISYRAASARLKNARVTAKVRSERSAAKSVAEAKAIASRTSRIRAKNRSCIRKV